MEPQDSTLIPFMVGRPIGLAAAAALRRRGVDTIPADAELREVEMPDDRSIDTGALARWESAPLDPDDDSPDDGAAAAGVTFMPVLRWLWRDGERQRWADTNEREVSAAYFAAVEAGSPPEFAAFDVGQIGPQGDPLPAAVPDKKADPGGYWAHQIYAQTWPEDVQALAADAVRAHHKADSSAVVVNLYGLGACDGWTAMSTGLKCFVRTLLDDGAGLYPGVLQGTIGMLARGAWKAPVDAPADDGDVAPWVSLDTLTGEAGADWRAHASGLVFPGRHVLLSGKAKQGKSTTVAAAVAGILTGADWLTGEVQAPGDVLWIGAVGESQAAEVRDLVTDAHAPVDALARLHFMTARPVHAIKAALAKFPIANLKAVIVDSARGLMTAEGGDEDSSDDVRRTMAVIAELAVGDVGALSIHHMRRDKDASVGDRTRGSGDWLAVVDVVAEFDRTAAGARLTYDGRRGGPSAPLELTRVGGSFNVSRGVRPAAIPGGARLTSFRFRTPAPGSPSSPRRGSCGTPKAPIGSTTQRAGQPVSRRGT